MISLAQFWSDGWCRYYQNVCTQPRGKDAECVKVANRFASAFKRELLLNQQGCQTGGGGVTDGKTATPEYRWECLCQRCGRQFELAHEHAEHICQECKIRDNAEE